MTKQNIAIIGAGLSGLTLAEELKDHAHVTLFEKARGLGGRMSTRYTDDFQFDHGAQFFTARSKSFQNFLKPFIAQNIVQEWTPKVVTLEAGEKPYKRDWFEPHYTASPKMNMLCKTIAKGHDIKIKTQIENLTQAEDGWFLNDNEGHRHGPYNWVISTAPAPQTANLLPPSFHQYDLIKNTQMQGCYSLMLGFEGDLKLNWDAAKVKNSPIEWMAIDSSKPSRKSGSSVLVQTTNDWAQAHIESEADDVRDLLMREVTLFLEHDTKNADYTSLHRWRYASTVVNEDAEHDEHFIDKELKIAVCGDWCIQGHVESAYLSAMSLANTLKYSL